MSEALLKVEHLRVAFPMETGSAFPVRDVSFSVFPGKTLGIVGESGCGKTLTGLSLLQLVPKPGRVAGGRILFRRQATEEPVDLAAISPTSDLTRSIRGAEIAMIFQEPMTALNPVYTIGAQIREAIRAHGSVSRQEARNRSLELLKRVGIPAPVQRADDYPHQLSGGMRQRAMIAMALSCNPRLLIADEPTTALDVTIQAQILDLLGDLQAESGMAIVLITHDLGVIADLADDILVMYAGRQVERGTPDQIFYRAAHPYTRGLLTSVPRFGAQSGYRLKSIPGTVPSFVNLPPGCAFRPRCEHAADRCLTDPPSRQVEPGHKADCWLEPSTPAFSSEPSAP